MSSRSQFRSASGCCICATKSSSSRFSNSARFAQYFSKCFGPKSEGRIGDICNACVLYVKRWLKAADQTYGKYEKVLDKKKGPGLKHITQIVKMQQRRQARLKAFGESCGHGMETRSKNQKVEFSSSNGNHLSNICITSKDSYKTEKDSYAYYDAETSTDHCSKSGGSSFSARSFLSSSIDQSGSSRPSCIREFREKSIEVLSQDNMVLDVFRVPEPRRNNPPLTNYKRRVHLPPVKLPNADEVDHLLREIMARNSEVVNLEIPLAMQNHLRLRSRTIMPVNSTLSTQTSNDQVSVSSDSFGSSVGNVDSLRY